MHRLLEALGNPQAAYPVVHVGGTKGKGSTASMLASILTASGYRTGLYTSPHVVGINERIQVNSQAIPEESLGNMVGQMQDTLEVARQREGGALSHFEVLTSLALNHFRQQQVEVAVVEVGLGGARDATNVFEERSCLPPS
eukprot:jgi/Botrbrau1/21469/Bobra.0216s0077.1